LLAIRYLNIMDTKEKTEKNTHHGHAIKRYRHTLGIKQEALASDMGISQALVSFYEQKKVIEDDMIDKFAKALNVAPALVKDLEEDPVTVIIENNTFENKEGNNIAYLENDNSTNTYNPIEQILELNKEKQALYERMLELEKEKNALLEKLLKERK
jgi:transcriptional regulator with XRE-family HTH domain